jgi:hypothetical protein
MKTLGITILTVTTVVLIFCLLILTWSWVADMRIGIISVDRQISRFFGYETLQSCRGTEGFFYRQEVQNAESETDVRLIKEEWAEYCDKTCPLLKTQIDRRPLQFSMPKVKTFIQKYESLDGNTVTGMWKRNDLIEKIETELKKYGKYKWPSTYCTSKWKEIGHFIRGSNPPKTRPMPHTTQR